MFLEVRNLVRHFNRVKAVDDISFSVEPGDVVGFVGPNGAGKTTTLRIIATLDDATSGDVFLNGTSLTDYPEIGRELIGYMPDALPEHADMTAHDYVDFFGRAFGMRGAALNEAVEEVVSFTGLESFRDKTLKHLSKGMKQRVSLARALVHRPRLLVMDEPANGLDPRARIELRELVTALAESGIAILISSHILTELSEMCGSVAIIEQGRLLGSGTVKSLASAGAATRQLFVRAVEPPPAKLAEMLMEMPHVLGARAQGGRCVAQIDAADEDAVAAILQELMRRGARIVEFHSEEAGLEEVFMRVTKGALA
jgi:ABC-2 type transport system ATP-binding protein